MMEDQRRVHDLNEGPDIQDEVIMTCAKSSFTTCGHNIESMTRINEGWTVTNEANKILTPPLIPPLNMTASNHIITRN